MTESQNSPDDQDATTTGFPLGRSLSGRLLLLTIVFVMIAEILIYFPSTANFRVTWLEERLAAAQIASLSLEATMGEEVRPELEAELLENAGVLQVVLHRDQIRMLMLARDELPMVDQSYDLRDRNLLTLIFDAFMTLFAEDRVILVKGTPQFGGGELIEIIIDETEIALRDLHLFAQHSELVDHHFLAHCHSRIFESAHDPRSADAAYN